MSLLVVCVDDFSRFSYLEVKPVGVLEVKLIEAKELTNKDLIGKSDPFAKLCIRPLPDKTKTSKTIVSNRILALSLPLIIFLIFSFFVPFVFVLGQPNMSNLE